MPASTAALEALGVPWADFERLTKIPIVLLYGDNIVESPVAEKGSDHWHVRLAMARLSVDAVNRRRGNATVVHLPALIIRGNTHFPFSHLSDLAIADLLSDFLPCKQLDWRLTLTGR